MILLYLIKKSLLAIGRFIMSVLGLDISTTCVGYCVYGPDLKEIGSVRLGSYGTNLFEKATAIRDVLINLKRDFDITNVAAEQRLMHFRAGMSSAKTLFTLADFHGRIVQEAYNLFDVEPMELNAQSARKKVFGKARFPDFDEVKEAIACGVIELEPQLEDHFPLRKALKGKKPSLLFRDHAYDEADAYVVARAAWEIENVRKVV